jgi:hypothetical protein
MCVQELVTEKRLLDAFYLQLTVILYFKEYFGTI